MQLLLLLTLLLLLPTWACAAPWVVNLENWEAAYAPTEAPTSDLAWKPIELGDQPMDANLTWLHYRTQFELPQEARFSALKLWFGGVNYVSKVYVNGQLAGGQWGGWTPFEVDLTAHIRPGQNSVTVAVGEVTHLLVPGVLKDELRTNIADWALTWKPKSVLAPVGSHPAQYGIWQPVEVRGYNQARIRDVVVTTSFRQKQIVLAITVESFADAPLEVELSPRLAGPRAPELAPKRLTLPARSTQLVSFEADWPNPELWSPESPSLYFVNTALTATTGNLLDEERTRFGFREIWREGADVYVNGVKTIFRGSAGHPGPSWKPDMLDYAKANNINCFRLHANVWPEEFFSHADEIGIYLIEESANWCFGDDFATDRPEYWQNLQSHWQGLIARDINHPSVVMYSLENELLLTGARPEEEVARELSALAEYVRGLDATRLIMFDGDEDPAGGADIINLHYPWEYPDHINFPLEAWWMEKPTAVQTYPAREWQWTREKPLYIGEFLWMPNQNVQAFSSLFGEVAFEMPQVYMKAKATVWADQVDAYRALGVTGFCPWTPTEESPKAKGLLWGTLKEHYVPVSIVVREPSKRFFAGQRYPRTCYVMNDSTQAIEADLVLTATDGKGFTSEVRSPVKLAPAERVKLALEFEAPPAGREPVAFKLTSRLDGIEDARGYEETCYSFSRRPLRLPEGLRVGLWDPAGTTTRLVADQDFTQVTSLDNDMAALDLLIVGADALGQGQQGFLVGKERSHGLMEFVRAGGRVIVLPQRVSQPEVLPLGLAEAPCARVFEQRPLEGLFTEAGLDFWQPDGYCARYSWSRPTTGATETFLTSATSQGLECSPLFKWRTGKGALYLCQLDVINSLEVEPLASELLSWLLDQASQLEPAPLTPVVLDPSGVWQQALDRLQIIYEAPTEFSNLPSSSLFLVNGQNFGLPAVGALRQAVEEGATVVLHNLDATASSVLEQLTEGHLAIRRQRPREVLTKQGELATWLNLHDLWWHPFLGWQQEEPETSVVPVATALPQLVVPEGDSSAIVTLGPLDFNLPTEGLASRNAEFFGIYAAAAVPEAPFNLPKEGSYSLTFRAWGTPAQGEFPRIDLIVDEVLHNLVIVSDAHDTYLVELGPLAAGQHTLQVVFTNDAVLNGQDRNLMFDRVQVLEAKAWEGFTPLCQPAVLSEIRLGKGRLLLDQVRWEAAGPYQRHADRYLSGLLAGLGVTAEGSTLGLEIPGQAFKLAGDTPWAQPTSDGFYLGSNGAVEVEIEAFSAGVYELAVIGGGTSVKGIFPKIRVYVDGKQVDELAYTGPGPEAVVTQAQLALGKQTVCIEFINDRWDPPEDMNYRLQSLRITKVSG